MLYRVARNDAALHECDVDARFRIEQEPQVFGCSARHALFDSHPIARQQFLVALPVLVIKPELRP